MLDQSTTKLETFRGLFKNDDSELTPPDHFKNAQNLSYLLPGGFKTRNGIGLSLLTPGVNIVRMRRYEIPGADDRILYLDDAGNLYDSVSGLVILAIASMTDFAMVALYGRAYISPSNGVEGLADTALYVYDPATSSTARIAGGDAPTGFTLTVVSASAQGTASVVNNTSPVVGALALTTSPFIPTSPNTLRFTLTVGTSTITAMQITVVGTDPTGAAQTEIYINQILSAGPTQYETPEVWKKITSITIDSKTGAAGTGLLKVEVVGHPPGKVEAGYHIVAIAYETDSGFITQPGPVTGGIGSYGLSDLQKKGSKVLNIGSIPSAPPTGTSKIRVLASKHINKGDYTGNVNGYELFFVPDSAGGTVQVGTTTAVLNFFDADLLDSADYLKDNFAEIPAGVCLLATSKGRLLIGGVNSTSAVGGTDVANNTVVWASKGGEPEAFSQTDGFVIIKPGGEGLKNFAEYRDLIYVYKLDRTYATQDNGDLISTWEVTTIDNAIGTTPHGVAVALGADSSTEDFIILAAKSGLEMFIGTYVEKPLTWKIRELWNSIDPTLFVKVEVAIDPTNNLIFVIAPIQTDEVNNTMILMGDYADGLSWENIKWCSWIIEPVITYKFIVTAVTPSVSSLALTTTPFIPTDPSSIDFVFAPVGNSTITAISITVVGLDAAGDPQSATYVDPILSNGDQYFTTPEVWSQIDTIDIDSMAGAAGTGKIVIVTTTLANKVEYHSIMTQIDDNGTVLKMAIKVDDTASDDPEAENGIYEWRARPRDDDNYSDLIGIRDISAISELFETYRWSGSDEGGVSQLAGIRIRLNGEGTFHGTLLGPTDQILDTEQTLDTFTIPTERDQMVLMKTNFFDDSVSFRGELSGSVGEYMIVSRIWLFGNELWIERPSI